MEDQFGMRFTMTHMDIHPFLMHIYLYKHIDIWVREKIKEKGTASMVLENTWIIKEEEEEKFKLYINQNQIL